jgi:hypothetical protein
VQNAGFFDLAQHGLNVSNDLWKNFTHTIKEISRIWGDSGILRAQILTGS